MTKCSVCGAELESGIKFCGECGTSIPVQTSPPPPPPPYTGTPREPLPDYPAPPPVPAPTSKKSRSTWVWVGGCAVIAVVACVVFAALAAYASSNLDVVELGPIKLFYATETPAPESSQMEDMSELESDQPLQAATYRGTSFDFDPFLANDIFSITLPELEEPLLDAAPEYLDFTFMSYPHLDTNHAPSLKVYPVDEFVVLNPMAGEIIMDLEDLLLTEPISVEGDIPFLPFWNAAQTIKVKIKYLGFRNGSGVRFLTQYGQDIWPINDQDLFYTFQGLTRDGRYYVSAVFPISHPDIPLDGSEYPGGDYQTFESNYESYITDTENLLNNSPDTWFVPEIRILDNLIESLYVQVE